MSAQTLAIQNILARRLDQLKRAANRQGVSAEDYLKRVLIDHLERIRRIEQSSFAGSKPGRS